MSKTLVVIGYSASQGQRRTTMVPIASDPDDWDAVRVPMHVAWMRGMGEATLVVSLSDYRYYGPDVLLARYLGRQPTSDRHAVVNAAGVVVAVLKLDRELDHKVFPLHRLHRDPDGKAVVGQQATDLALLA